MTGRPGVHGVSVIKRVVWNLAIEHGHGSVKTTRLGPLEYFVMAHQRTQGLYVTVEELMCAKVIYTIVTVLECWLSSR